MTKPNTSEEKDSAQDLWAAIEKVLSQYRKMCLLSAIGNKGPLEIQQTLLLSLIQEYAQARANEAYEKGLHEGASNSYC